MTTNPVSGGCLHTSPKEAALKEQALHIIRLDVRTFDVLAALQKEEPIEQFRTEDILEAEKKEYITRESGRFELTFSGRAIVAAANTLIWGHMGVGRVYEMTKKKRAHSA